MQKKALISPRQAKEKLALTAEQKRFIDASRQTAQRLLLREEKRLLIVTGPCSIHDWTSAIEYAEKLNELAKELSNSVFLVMRVFVEKPRTQGGWKGLLYDPHLDKSHAIEEGILLSRKLLLALAERQIPAATEFVDPLASLYLDDLITWGFIGARTSASQPHRQLASSFSFPIGFKNGIDGNVEQAIHGVIAAKTPHVFMQIDEEGSLGIKTSRGNPYGHVVLRGSDSHPNYDRVSVDLALSKIAHFGLPPRLLVDCAHGNSQKQLEKQKEAFYTVLDQIAQGKKEIFGLMLESHLEAGSQLLPETGRAALKYAVSVTDPCLGWAATEQLILDASSATR